MKQDAPARLAAGQTRRRGRGFWAPVVAAVALALALFVPVTAPAQTPLTVAAVEARSAEILTHLGFTWRFIAATQTPTGVDVEITEPSFIANTFGDRVVLNDLVIELTPIDDDVVGFKVLLDPPVITVVAQTGLESERLTAERLEIQGRWSAALGRIFALNVLADDVAIDGNPDSSITAARMLAAIESPASGLGDLTLDLNLSDLSVSELGEQTFAADSLAITLAADAFDPAIDTAFRSEFGSGPLGLPANAGGPMTDEDARALLGRLVSDFAVLANGFTLAIAVDHPRGGAPGQAPVDVFRLALALTDVRDGLATLSIDTVADGLDFSQTDDPPPAEAAPYLPQRFVLEMSLRNLPFGDILVSMGRTLRAGPPAVETAGGIIGLQTVALMMRHDLALHLDTLLYQGALVQAEASGHAQLDAMSAMGAVWAFDLSLVGLDGLLDVARQTGASQQELGDMQMLLALGRQTDGGPGAAPSLRYTFTGDGEGVIMVNDVDLRTLTV